MHKAVRFFRDSLPDTIVLITPHGLSLEDDFAIYLNQGVSGDALWENEYPFFFFSFSLFHINCFYIDAVDMTSSKPKQNLI